MRIRPLLSITLAVLVAGCGANGSSQPEPPDLGPVPAPRIPGALVVQCGKDNNSQELYSLVNGELRRLTVTRAGGVNTFSLHGNAVAISRDSDDMFAGLQAELAPLGRAPVRGTRFGAGQQVALRDREMMAFTRVEEHSSGLLWDAIYVKRQGAKARRIAEFRQVWEQRYVRGRLAAVVNFKHRFFLARNIGTSVERKDPLRTRRAVRVAISRTGRAAYASGKRGSPPRVHIMSATGKHLRTFTTDWAPVAWSRDQDRLLVTRGPYADPHIGLFDATTGHVDDLGVLACGAVIHAQWRDG